MYKIVKVRLLQITNQILKPWQVSGYTRIWIYKIVARSPLSYSNESWTMGRNDE